MAKEEIKISIAIGDKKDNQISNVVVLTDTKKNLIKEINEDLVFRIPRCMHNNSTPMFNLYPEDDSLWMDVETLEQGGIFKLEESKDD